jgi:hypothetical protein
MARQGRWQKENTQSRRRRDGSNENKKEDLLSSACLAIASVKAGVSVVK